MPLLRQGVRALIAGSNGAGSTSFSLVCQRGAGQSAGSLTRVNLLSRNYSLYPKFYVNPVYLPLERQRLEEAGELQKLAYVPILPTNNDQNASVWHDPMIVKFTNYIMKTGFKELARELVDMTFKTIKATQLEKYYKTTDPVERAKIIINPYEIFNLALANTKPFLETTPVKRGGTKYQVPVPVRPKRQTFLALKWLLEAGVDKDDQTKFYTKMAIELLDAANNTGRVVKRKQDLHKLCEANRAYAHYRWG